MTVRENQDEEISAEEEAAVKEVHEELKQGAATVSLEERGLPKEETRVSFEEFISRADTIRAGHRLAEDAPTAAELIREGRGR